MGMATTQIRAIHSRQNSRVKELRAALRSPGRAGGVIGLEGTHLVEEALASAVVIETIFVEAGKEGVLAEFRLPASVEVLSLAADVFASVVSTETPQPLAALARMPTVTLDEVFGDAGTTALVLIVAGLQDPGNLGTLVRSAEAFGATGMVLLPGTTSLWNAKALRASSGSAFRVPVVNCDGDSLSRALSERGVKLLAAVAHNGSPEQDLRGDVAILIGNEGAGLSQEWIDAADARVMIPCPGPTESLNAAVAGSVLLYEASRQRRLAR